MRSVLTELGNKSIGMSASGLSATLDARYRQDVVRQCQELLNGRYPFSPNGPDMQIDDFAKLFRPGGVYDDFFKTQLAEFVDKDRSPWAWRSGAGSSIIRPALFEQAFQIKEMFFDGAQPKVRFQLSPLSLNGDVESVAFELDGQKFEHRFGPEKSFPLSWPGEPPGVATVQFEGRNRQNLSQPGPWGWFHLLERSGLTKQSDNSFLVTFEKGGASVRMRLMPSSARHPFGRRDLFQFSCG
jgi:type VI secretion system protein ImpL